MESFSTEIKRQREWVFFLMFGFRDVVCSFLPFFFQLLQMISEVDRSIVIKFWRMFDGDQNLKNCVRNLGPLLQKFGGPKTSKFGPNFATWSQIFPERNKISSNGNGILHFSCARVTKFGELWSTNGEKQDRSFDQLNALVLRGSRFVVRTCHYVVL